MFNLEKSERYIIIFMSCALLAGIAFVYHKKTHVASDIRVKKFGVEDLSGRSGKGRAVLGARKININEAGPDQLSKLSGIGSVLAERIVKYRNENGRFGSPEDVIKVKGVGKSLYEKIKDYIAVD